MADYVKAGPLNRDEMTSYISSRYPFTGSEAEILINRSLTSRTGMGSNDSPLPQLPSGRRLWVTHLEFTMPGMFILEED
jgi:hypothetical protein